MSGKFKNCDEEEYGVYLLPEKNLNVALATEGATVVNNTGQQCLNGDFTNCDNHTGHYIGKDPNCIVIKLRHQYLLNRLRLRLWDKLENGEQRYYSYYVEVSINNKDWIKICDHTKYPCRSWQYIAFPSTVVRYIRIVGTYNLKNNGFHVVFVKAYFSNTEVKFDKKLEPILGLLAPTSNVATIARGARVIEGMHTEFLLNGDLNGHNLSTGFTKHGINHGGICVQLSQPFVISSMRLLLWDGDDRSYGFDIHVSTNKTNWILVCSRSNRKSWQDIDLPEQLPVVYIRIMGTVNTYNSNFHCVHFECPSTERSGQEVGPSQAQQEA